MNTYLQNNAPEPEAMPLAAHFVRGILRHASFLS